MKSTLNLVAALACATSLTACNGSDWITGGDLIRPGEPTGTLEVVNGTDSTDLVAVLISNCDANTYGLNRLPDGVSIAPGYSYDFTVSAGCWDVDAGSGEGEARHRMQVDPGGITQYTVTGD
jgi:hypothetical protein